MVVRAYNSAMTAAPQPPPPSRRPLAGCLLIAAAFTSLFGGICFTLLTGISHSLGPRRPPPPPEGLLGFVPGTAIAILFSAAMACVVSGVLVWTTAKISVPWTRIFLIALMVGLAALIIGVDLLEARAFPGDHFSSNQQFSAFLLIVLEAIVVGAWIIALRRH